MPIIRIQHQARPTQNIKVSSRDALARLGPTVPVVVGKYPTTPIQTSIKIEITDTHQVRALLDTGAGSSCINEKLAVKAGLPIIDKQHVGGVAGKKEHNVYLGSLLIPQLQWTKLGRFVGVDISTHEVILGRDLLSDCILIYDGNAGSIILTR